MGSEMCIRDRSHRVAKTTWLLRVPSHSGGTVMSTTAVSVQTRRTVTTGGPCWNSNLTTVGPFVRDFTRMMTRIGVGYLLAREPLGFYANHGLSTLVRHYFCNSNPAHSARVRLDVVYLYGVLYTALRDTPADRIIERYSQMADGLLVWHTFLRVYGKSMTPSTGSGASYEHCVAR